MNYILLGILYIIAIVLSLIIFILSNVGVGMNGGSCLQAIGQFLILSLIIVFLFFLLYLTGSAIILLSNPPASETPDKAEARVENSITIPPPWRS